MYWCIVRFSNVHLATNFTELIVGRVRCIQVIIEDRQLCTGRRYGTKSGIDDDVVQESNPQSLAYKTGKHEDGRSADECCMWREVTLIYRSVSLLAGRNMLAMRAM